MRHNKYMQHVLVDRILDQEGEGDIVGTAGEV